MKGKSKMRLFETNKIRPYIYIYPAPRNETKTPLAITKPHYVCSCKPKLGGREYQYARWIPTVNRLPGDYERKAEATVSGKRKTHYDISGGEGKRENKARCDSQNKKVLSMDLERLQRRTIGRVKG